MEAAKQSGLCQYLVQRLFPACTWLCIADVWPRRLDLEGSHAAVWAREILRRRLIGR